VNKWKTLSGILQNDPKSLIDVDYTLVKDHKFYRDNWKIYSFFLEVIWIKIKRIIACKFNRCMIKRFWLPNFQFLELSSRVILSWVILSCNPRIILKLLVKGKQEHSRKIMKCKLIFLDPINNIKIIIEPCTYPHSAIFIVSLNFLKRNYDCKHQN